MRFVGRGHPAIRATHAKTLELSPDESITARATCVVAVGTTVEPAVPLAGPVRIRLAAGAQRFSVDAIANPSWDPAGPAVIRRGPQRLPGTFATEADAAAADLPRYLADAIADPDALVTVDVMLRPAEVSTLVLFAALGPSPALSAELAAADLAFALDDGARELVGHHAARPGSRTLLVATADLPWRGERTAERIETVGLPPTLAAAAASPGTGPVLLGGSDPATRAVQTVAFADLDRALAGRPATLVQPYCPPVTDPADLASHDPVAVCLHAVDDVGIEPTVRVAIDGLLAAGVATKTAAGTLATLTGWDRRRAYDAVLAWRS